MSERPRRARPEQTDRRAAAETAHDPSGLDLARSIADSVGAGPPSALQEAPAAARRGSDPQSVRRPARRPRPQAARRRVGEPGRHQGLEHRHQRAHPAGPLAALVGPTNAAHSRPEAYAETVLTVRTDSTAWATRSGPMAPQLVALLNEQLGDGTVTRVTVLGPGRAVLEEGPARRSGTGAVRGTRTADRRPRARLGCAEVLTADLRDPGARHRARLVAALPQILSVYLLGWLGRS